MSGPVPSPSMNGMIGSSGTTSSPASNPIRCPSRGGASFSLIARGVYQPSKRGQIAPVGFVLDLFRRLQQLRDATESLVVEQEAESVEAELSVADVLVPVDARSESLFRIVQVKEANILDADVSLEVFDRLFVRVARSKI